MQVQQFSVKIFAKASESFDQDALIPIFHKWIRERRLQEALLIDVADYRHVPNGPGLMLIAHEAHYGLDERDGLLGLEYARKRDPVGEPMPKLRQALGAALDACRDHAETAEKDWFFARAWLHERLDEPT